MPFLDLGIFSQVSLSSEGFADWRAWPREPGRAGQGLLFEATWDLATNHEAPNSRVKQTSNLPIQPPRPQIQQRLGRERNPQLEPKKRKSAAAGVPLRKDKGMYLSVTCGVSVSISVCR